MRKNVVLFGAIGPFFPLIVCAQERVFAQSQRCGGEKSRIDVINFQNWTTVDSIGIQTSKLAVVNILQ